eukprot:3461791-Amphidinium_carterae.1
MDRPDPEVEYNERLLHYFGTCAVQLCHSPKWGFHEWPPMDFQVRPEISVARCGEIGRELAARARHAPAVKWQNRHFGSLKGQANRWGTLDECVSPMVTVEGLYELFRPFFLGRPEEEARRAWVQVRPDSWEYILNGSTGESSAR